MRNFKIIHNIVGPFKKDAVVSEQQFLDLPGFSNDQDPNVATEGFDRLLRIGAIELTTDETGDAPAPAETAETAGDEDGLDEMNKGDLVAAAEEEGVEFDSKATKQDLIQLIRAKRAGLAGDAKSDDDE